MLLFAPEQGPRAHRGLHGLQPLHLLTTLHGYLEHVARPDQHRLLPPRPAMAPIAAGRPVHAMSGALGEGAMQKRAWL